MVVEGGGLSIEGYIVKGLRGEAGDWDLDGMFTVQDEDGLLTHVCGWNCTTEVQ